MNAVLPRLIWFHIILPTEDYRKVCVHGPGKDSGGKGALLDVIRVIFTRFTIVKFCLALSLFSLKISTSARTMLDLKLNSV